MSVRGDGCVDEENLFVAGAVVVIEQKVHAEILRRLKAAEEEHNMTVLYACESGSRAWGFASPDSDYDVRFIYARPKEWYLSFDVETRRDVIEYPIVDEIDCSGWDLRKALYLFTRTNGALLEWLVSPIRYVEIGTMRARLADLAPAGANLIALCYHYSHMARSNARGYLFQDQVRLKKYLYVLRPLLAIRFIEKVGQPPPIEFAKLVSAVAPESIVPGIAKVLEIKRHAPEVGLADPIPEINAFIESELARHGDSFSGQGRPDLVRGESVRSELNAVFRETFS